LNHAGVRRIGEDHLVTRIGERQQGVKHVVAVTLRDHDFAVRVVLRAAAAVNQLSYRLFYLIEPGERKVGIRLVAADRGTFHLDDPGVGRDVSV
jgi:hypothetical protein